MSSETREKLEAVEEAEKAVIGSILVDASCSGNKELIAQIAKILRTEDFRWERNQRIFRAMLNCEGSPNQIIVAEELNSEGKLIAGDCAYMSECIVATPTHLDCLDYAEVVRRYSLERRQGKPLQRGLDV